jgi:cytochrome c553
MIHRALIRRVSRRLGRSPLRVALTAMLVLGGALSAHALLSSSELATVKAVHAPALADHVDQVADLNAKVQAGDVAGAFATAFAAGNEMFQTAFNAVDGGGAVVHGHERYTRVPRADQTNTGEWFTHVPARATGPNAAACTDCHNQGGDDGSGGAVTQAHRDPKRGALLSQFIERNTPHLFGMGGVSRLAEEMTTDLINIRNNAGCNCTSTSTSTASCSARTRSLLTKGINFGTATISRASSSTACTVTLTPPSGSTVPSLNKDLIVRPFQWKGSVAFARDFARDANHNEIGMQAVEFFSSDTQDGDADGITGELTVGDITAMAVYNQAQPRPTTKVELASLGLIPALAQSELDAISRGSTQFDAIGCASCHVRQLTATSPVVREPSSKAEYRDKTFPGGRTPSTLGLTTSLQVSFNLTADLPDNQFLLPSGNTLGNFESNGSGGAVVRLFGDLRRHDIGSNMAETIDEVGTGASVFLTENLWGVGTTAPYMHNGMATTLTEAIFQHHGEAESSRTNFNNLTTAAKQDLVAFLNNMVLFKVEQAE